MNSPITLDSLGWNAFFATAWEAHAGADRIPARIAREDRGRYLVWSAEGAFTGEITGAFRHQHTAAAAFPAVGDWVVAEPVPGEAKVRIHAVLPRRTVFTRTAAGDTSEEQVAAANIDVAFLVSGLDHDFNLRRIERYVTLTYESGARPVILLNKADLAEDLDAKLGEVESVAFGVPVHPVSALQGEGVERVRQYLVPGVTAAVLGSSGVGKSTLINALAGDALMATSGVREDDSRGRHTTTHRQLVLLPGGGLLVDTPGMRELQMSSAGDGLAQAFADVEALIAQCRFRDCSHAAEPGCAVRSAMESGDLDPDRYAAYRKLQREIDYADRRGKENFVAEQRRRDRAFGKMVRKHVKEKHDRR